MFPRVYVVTWVLLHIRNLGKTKGNSKSLNVFLIHSFFDTNVVSAFDVQRSRSIAVILVVDAT